MKPFKIGDRVHDKFYGGGTVERIFDDDSIPRHIGVHFDNRSFMWFYDNGQFIYGNEPTLHHIDKETTHDR
jgi:hypothetical protein